MLSRRSFGYLASFAGAGLYLTELRAQTPESPVSKPSTRTEQFSVMLWTLTDSRSFDERLATVAKAGYHHVELVDEFQHWSDEEFGRNLSVMRSLSLTVDAIAGLKTGFADPDKGSAFLSELQALIPVARRFGSPQIILLSGNRREGLPAGRQHQAALDSLHRAAALLKKENLTGVIEPIDRLENASSYLDGVTEAFTLTRAVASPQLKVLYDLYHEQRSQGNLIEKLENNIDQVGLIHVADVPGRHQPGTGEMNFDRLFQTLGRLQYTGVVAMEFYPVGDPVDVLRQSRQQAERSFDAGV